MRTVSYDIRNGWHTTGLVHNPTRPDRIFRNQIMYDHLDYFNALEVIFELDYLMH